MDNLFLNIPEYMWGHIFTVVNTLICGLIVAFFTSTFLKKKEERTRIAGVIVEKRINSEQNILHFLETALFKEELTKKNSSKYDAEYAELLKQFNLPDPYEGHMQYARVFKSQKDFECFIDEFEELIIENKLWLDSKVRFHLVFMQIYFGFFRSIPLMVKRIPLPRGNELTDREFTKVCDRILLLLGSSFDFEINYLMSELDELIVTSVYKLDLKRPKKSIMRKNLFNVDIEKCKKRFSKKTYLGTSIEDIFEFIMNAVYAVKGIDFSSMADEEYGDFIQSADPQLYSEIIESTAEFQEFIRKVADDNGCIVATADDADKYPNQYALSIKDILEGKDAIKTTEELMKERTKKS